MTGLAYPLLLVFGIVLAAHLWERGRMATGGGRLELVFLGGLFGMALGAKLGFAVAEGWWTRPAELPLGSWRGLGWIVHGKTVTGGLLGAYAGVELAKRAIGHRSPTGDLFALTVPASLMLGRVGCVLQGCCLGVPLDASWYTLADAGGVERWPAPVVELVFNAAMLAGFYAWHRRHADPERANPLRGQLFHVYLIGYGLFRAAHEVVRETPRVWGALSGYQGLAGLVFVLGVVRFVQRWRDAHAADRCAQPGPSHARKRA